jgi:hypothetical protein
MLGGFHETTRATRARWKAVDGGKRHHSLEQSLNARFVSYVRIQPTIDLLARVPASEVPAR